jgi:TPR repeat protein
MMTLKYPFQCDDVFQLFDKISNQEISSLPNQYSNKLNEVVRKMLVKDSLSRIKLSKILSKIQQLTKENQTNHRKQLDEFEFPEDEPLSNLVAERNNDNFVKNSQNLPVKDERRKNDENHNDEKHNEEKTKSQEKEKINQNELRKPSETKSQSQMDPKELTHQAMKILKENCFDLIAQKEAFAKLKASADRNDLDACWMFAAFFINSIDASENREKAIKYSSKAMNAGISEGTYWFGRCFDGIRGFSIFKKASEEGNLSGQNEYARCYFNGKGVGKNRKKGMKLQRIVFRSEEDIGHWFMLSIFKKVFLILN